MNEINGKNDGLLQISTRIVFRPITLHCLKAGEALGQELPPSLEQVSLPTEVRSNVHSVIVIGGLQHTRSMRGAQSRIAAACEIVAPAFTQAARHRRRETPAGRPAVRPQLDAAL